MCPKLSWTLCVQRVGRLWIEDSKDILFHLMGHDRLWMFNYLLLIVPDIYTFCKLATAVGTGIAKNPQKRQRNLQIDSPLELKIVCQVKIGSRDIESKVHDLLRHWHSRGEWF